MNIVFLNSLEKRTEHDRIVTAQVSICERHGEWHLFWDEPKPDGHAEQTVWYEGGSWQELLSVFRHGIAVKLGEGYSPVIDGMLDDRTDKTSKMYGAQMLACYSDLNPNEALYAALTQWRRSQAAAVKKAPYFVATNRMLRLIGTFIPQTPEELLQIPGFGENKVELYGTGIIEITKEVPREHRFPLDWVKEKLDPLEFTQWLYKQKEVKYKQEMDKLTGRRRLLEGVQQGRSIAELQEQCGMQRRELVQMLEELERDGYDVEPVIERELRDMPAEEQALIWEAMQTRGDKYVKPVLLQAYGDDIMKANNIDLLYERIRLLRLRFRRQGEAVKQAV